MKSFLTSLALFSVLFMASCSTGSDSSMGNLQVRLHDAPIKNAEEVNISIKEVVVKGEDGWSVISNPNQSYNLLELTNGAYEVLGDAELPAGRYKEIRLVLHETGNNIVIDGQVHPLKVPSGSQSGLKLKIDAEIKENITYVLLLDFDVSQSIVKAGNSKNVKYLLKPVIRAKNKAVTGAVAGTVKPAEARAMVFATQNSDTLGFTIADTLSGEFKLMGLEEGSYDISINPRNDGFQARDTTGIQVTIGETNDLGSIEVSETPLF